MTQGKIWRQIKSLFDSQATTKNEDFVEQLEDILLGADIGLKASSHIMKSFTREFELKSNKSTLLIEKVLSNEIFNIVKPLEQSLMIKREKPLVVLLVGANGSGKTTTAGKLANYIKKNNLSVLFGAADTYRAAAVEQIISLGELTSVEVISRNGKEPAAIAYETVATGLKKKIDIMIIDTSGRLPNQDNLIRELVKIKRVIRGFEPQVDLETILTIDSNTGQNSVAQVMIFDNNIGIDGLVLTKMDGTARGGVVVAIAGEKKLPIRYIGTGEGMNDLQEFNAKEFTASLLR